MEKLTTHYDHLQVSHTASSSVIRAAYKTLLQKWHPDLNQNHRELAYQNFHLIKHAFDVLSNPELRLRHDQWIKNMGNFNNYSAEKLQTIFNYYSTEEKNIYIDVVA